MKNENLETIFKELKKLLKKHAKGLEARDTTIITGAKDKKAAYSLSGKKEVSIIAGRKPQKTYVAGIIKQKHFVGLYMMPVYSHPKRVVPLNPQLKKFLKGKSCFHVTRLDTAILADIHRLVKLGIAVYKKEGWI